MGTKRLADNEIHIAQALGHIRDDPNEFSLSFVTVDGEKRHKERVRFGGRSIIQRAKEGYSEKQRQGREMKLANRILVYDIDAAHSFYVYTYFITHFQGLRVVHTYAKPRT